MWRGNAIQRKEEHCKRTEGNVTQYYNGREMHESMFRHRLICYCYCKRQLCSFHVLSNYARNHTANMPSRAAHNADYAFVLALGVVTKFFPHSHFKRSSTHSIHADAFEFVWTAYFHISHFSFEWGSFSVYSSCIYLFRAMLFALNIKFYFQIISHDYHNPA